MNDPEAVVLESVKGEHDRWIAVVSFRDRLYELRFRVDGVGRLRHEGRTPMTLTREGTAVCALVDRVRQGKALTLPCTVESSDVGPRLPSVHDPNWSDWSDAPGIKEVWLETAEKAPNGRWVAQLRIDGQPGPYELEILPGPTLREIRGPAAPSFQSFTFDLTRLLLRMEGGQRFALPFKLRTRWPTPPDPIPIYE